MRFWLVTVGEPVPTDGENVRLLRTGILAQTLSRRGHDVVWWTSSFDHFQKKMRYPSDSSWVAPEGYKIQFLKASGYRKNVSFQRFYDHGLVASRFRALCTAAPKPDAILCSFPTIELARECVRYGHLHNTPVILDIRDLWPDLFLDVLPAALRFIGSAALLPYTLWTNEACRKASGIIGVSEGYRNWGLARAKRSANVYDQVFPLGYELPRQFTSEHQVWEHLEGLGVPKQKRLIWFLGSFGRSYDLSTVISAAKNIMGTMWGRDVHFVFSGDGDQGADWKQQAAGITNVTFTGWVDRNQIAALMVVSELGLAAYAPGALQGIPNKLIEFFAGSVPVLSSLQGEARYLIEREQVGWTYSPGDPQSFNAVLRAAMAHPEQIRSYGKKAYALYEREFSANSVYGRLAEYMESL